VTGTILTPLTQMDDFPFTFAAVFRFLARGRVWVAELRSRDLAATTRGYPFRRLPGEEPIEGKARRKASADKERKRQEATKLRELPPGAWPTRHKHLRHATEGVSRAELEKDEAVSLSAPVTMLVEDGGLPETIRDYISGSSRPRTVRQRLKYWQQFARWHRIDGDGSWPLNARPFINYLEHRDLEGCGRTVPGQLQLGYSFIEKVGEFDVPIATSPAIETVVASMERRLSAGHGKCCKAPELPLVVVLSLELYLMDE